LEKRAQRRRQPAAMTLVRRLLAATFGAALGLLGVAAPASHAPPVVVPFDLVDGHIFVTARIDGGAALRLVVDSGAGDVLAAETATALGLPETGSFTVYGTGERAEAARSAHVGSVDIGGATLHDQDFTVLSFAQLRAAEGVERFDGLLGHELFDRYVVRIDYAAQTLTLEDAADDAGDPTAAIVPFKFFGTMPEVEGEVDGIPGRFTIDTGDRGSLSLLVPFVTAHDLVGRYHPIVEGVAGWGIGGPVRAKLTRVGHLRFGTIDVEGPVTRLPDAKHGFFTTRSVAGNIGFGVLRRFTVTFDYARRRLVLIPNAGAAAPDVYDRSGMWLVQKADGFGVEDVLTDGPAARAGVRVGDVIQAVDGRPARDIGLAPQREALRHTAVGTTVSLRILRGAKVTNLTLLLADVV
jgi:hypothetical protein